MTIQNLVLYSELIASLVGTIYFYKYNQTQLKYFLYLLWFITFNEFFASFIVVFEIDQLLYINNNGLRYNFWILNFLYFLFFIVIFFIYYQSVENKRYKIYIKIFGVSYIIISIINWIFIQSFVSEISVLPYIIGSFFLIISIIFYFIELLKSDKIVIFHRLLLFWISVGLLVYHTGTIPFSIKWNSYIHIPYIHDLYYINFILAVTMYLIFTFGFIWSKKE